MPSNAAVRVPEAVITSKKAALTQARLLPHPASGCVVVVGGGWTGRGAYVCASAVYQVAEGQSWNMARTEAGLNLFAKDRPCFEAASGLALVALLDAPQRRALGDARPIPFKSRKAFMRVESRHIIEGKV